MKNLFLIFVLLVVTTCLYSTIINVPADQPTIQAGINVAVDADTVLVQSGTYVENINYNGMNITVASLFLTTQDTTYISQTIIDGDSLDSVVIFESGETQAALLCGFTITNGFALDGGGIYCDSSSPILQKIRIINNFVYSNFWSDSGRGGGIYCIDSSPGLVDVALSGNSAVSGGGIYCYLYSNPSLENVTITGNAAGSGGGIYCYWYSNPSLENVTITGNSAADCGGGIYCSYNSNPSLQNVTISGNSAGSGGGIYCYWYSNPSLENVTITGNAAGSGGGIYCENSSPSFDPVDRCNIFLNFAISGWDLYAINCPTIDVIVDTFTVLQPDDYFAYPIDNFTFDILNAKVEQVDQDLYVSPDGSNNNSGLTVDDPLLTIYYALAKILPDSTNPLTIHLSNGTYSPSGTGERFSLNCRSYVSLLGEDEFSTILDGEGLSNILFSENDNNFSIENMTIQNGFNGIYCNNSSPSLENVTVLDNSDSGIYCDNSSPSLENVTVLDNSNSGIYCDSSSPSLQNVTITGNSTSGYYADGGGIYCYESSPILQNVTIVNNSAYSEYGASSNGGGIYCENSSLILQNVTITGNSAVWYGRGGGIYCEDNSSLSLENVTITGNSADDKGGGIYLYYSSISFSVDNRCNIYSNTIGNTRGFGVDMYAVGFDTRHVILDTFTVMTPTDYYASPIDNFTFDILHSIIDSLINADVYVSVDGDDSNSGTSPDLPFKTIKHALSRIVADSLNINTIHLAPGVYSNSTNGEIFPIDWSSYVNLSGSNEDETILDAEGTSRVMDFEFVTDAIISNITITNGSSLRGGGIYCWHSSPSLENVTITGNSAYNGSGGGIFCQYSSPSLENVTITGNSARYSGGGIYCSHSSPSLVNVSVSGNSSGCGGGGISCSFSSPSLVNVSVSGNTADTHGGGIYCTWNSNPSLVNCILWNNLPEEIYIYFSGNPDSTSVTATYSDIEGGWAGEGNIEEDPLFVGTGVFPYSLLEDSPCIDAGDPDPIYYDPEDPGNPGYALYPAMGTIINDMGAYGGPNAIGWSVVGLDDNVIVHTPEVFLHQNYPNPFNPTTTISFNISNDPGMHQGRQNEQIELVVYNLKGQKVKQLVSDRLSAGQHSVVWNGKDDNGKSVSSGIYFYKLKSGRYEKIRKMILIK